MVKKKAIKKIFFIIIILFILLVIMEITLYIAYGKRVKKELEKQHSTYSYPEYSPKLMDFDDWYKLNCPKCFRNPVGLNYKKMPIIIFGCSFAYGERIDEEQTVSYKLSYLTKRPVYNRALGSWGVQHMLYQLRRKDFYKQVKKPEYVIYIYINDHIRRLYNYVYSANELYMGLIYKKNKDELTQDHLLMPYIDGLYINKIIREYYAQKIGYDPKRFNQNFDFLKLHFIKSKKELEKNYPNTKFVILIYQDSFTDRWPELEKEGFIIIKVKDLVSVNLNNNKYKAYDNVHPNGKAWDVILPVLIKKLNL